MVSNHVTAQASRRTKELKESELWEHSENRSATDRCPDQRHRRAV